MKTEREQKNTGYIIGSIATAIGEIPQISTQLTITDFWGSVKARWDINRNNYIVEPGLYAIGNPGKKDEILVTSNYKLTFDIVRKNLKGQNVWLLVLDTKGVNVWCAAGKGTFGTAELASKIKQFKLNEVVDHHSVIVPQLGAPGISAYKTKEETGFTVKYGPIRIQDFIEYKNSGYKATPQMRTVQFPINERIKLIPVEIAEGSKKFLLISIILLLMYCVNNQGFDFLGAYNQGVNAFLILLAGFIAGTMLTPALLPFVPVKAFATKGAILGFLLSALLFPFLTEINVLEKTGLILFATALSSYAGMNFTGASTYTSLSGVLKEMKYAVPVQIIMASLGTIIWLTGRFVIEL